MFRRYFQTEEEEGGAGSSGDEEAEAADDLPAPEEVWSQVSLVLCNRLDLRWLRSNL
jgi:hypothetical protein